MKQTHIIIYLIAITLFICAAAPVSAQSELLKLEAVASYYGAEFHGRLTANGETFNMNDLTAAHKTLAFGTLLEVTNLESGKKVIVRVNDRGPFVEGRELDVSMAAAESLGMIKTGTARVSIRKLAGIDTTVANPGNPQPATTISTPPMNPAEGRTIPVDSGTPQKNPAEGRTIPGKSNTTDPITANPIKVTTAGIATATPVLTETSTSTTWRIQLGSFSQEENATRFVIKLRKDGFNPSFEKTATLYRVILTGITAGELEKTKSKLANAGYNDFLVRQEAW